MSDAHQRLISYAAALVRCEFTPSSFAEDYSHKMPAYILRQFELLEEESRATGNLVRRFADELKASAEPQEQK